MSRRLLAFACLGPVIGAVAAVLESNWTTLAWTLIALMWTFNTYCAIVAARQSSRAAGSWRDWGLRWRNYAIALETSRQRAGEDNPSQGGTE